MEINAFSAWKLVKNQQYKIKEVWLYELPLDIVKIIDQCCYLIIIMTTNEGNILYT